MKENNYKDRDKYAIYEKNRYSFGYCSEYIHYYILTKKKINSPLPLFF